MNLVELPIADIHPYEKNPRLNDNAVDAVAESIREFGFKSPIIVDKDKVIICGHTRYKASLKLGLTKVPVVIADDLSPKQVKAYRLADNKVSELAEWDLELLESELLELGGFDMTQFGFDLIEEEPTAEDDHYDPDDLLDNMVEPKAKYGDIYKLGRHYLMCGDSCKDVDTLLHGEDMDLVVTDPPYNVDYSDDRKIENDNMSREKFLEFLTSAFDNLKGALRAGGAFYIWYASRSGREFEQALENVDLKVRQQLIWVKNTLVLGRQDYQWRHEPCLYGWKDGAPHYFTDDRTLTTVFEKDEDFSKWKKEDLVNLAYNVFSAPGTIIHEDRPTKSELHPTMKPIPLIGQLVANSSKKGDKVLDIFGGSGSTLIACEQLGRTCYTMELDPKYVDVIIDRYEQLTGDKAEFIKNIIEKE